VPTEKDKKLKKERQLSGVSLKVKSAQGGFLLEKKSSRRKYTSKDKDLFSSHLREGGLTKSEAARAELSDTSPERSSRKVLGP